MACTHKVIEQLEEHHGSDILLLGRNTRYDDDWEITVDGETIGLIGRYRDKNSNTVYELSSEAFRKIIEDSL